MAIRIRKLAKEIGCTPEDVIALLQRHQQRGYDDADKQIPAAVEALVRRHAKELASAAARGLSVPARAAPKAAPRGPELTAGFEEAMLGADYVARRQANDAADAEALRAAMSGVRPIGRPAAPGGGARAAAPVAGASTVAAPVASTRASAVPFPAAAAAAAAATAIRARAPLSGARAELALAERLQAAEAALADARAEASVLRGTVETLRSEREAALHSAARAVQAYEEADAHRRSLSRELSERDAARAPTALRDVFERRGLRGDDEIALALRALVDARRTAELLDAVYLSDPRALEEVLWSRILLVADGEEVPAGLVPVRVPSERSEAPESSPNRAALSRFSTACLVHGARKIVIVGGSPAYHRVLREGVDRRIDLRLVDGTRRGSIPQAQAPDFVFVWAPTLLDHRVSEQFPGAIHLPVRGLSRMLAEATAYIERA
jgi:hypothetical protein